MKGYFAILLCIGFLHSCQRGWIEDTGETDADEVQVQSHVERVDTMGLVVLYPDYSTIDFVCGTMPAKKDSSVILFAEAAYTGECLQECRHSNIAGDHVSAGVRYKGYRCKRNTGAFVYYNGKWKFCTEPYSSELDAAAKNGGAGFAQELILLNGSAMVTRRKDSNKNQFRALCCRDGRLCIIESGKVVSFGDFRKKLMDYGVSDAIYLDMGGGWNHAWYRSDDETIVELHPKTHNYCTNWITFYK